MIEPYWCASEVEEPMGTCGGLPEEVSGCTALY